MSEAANPHRGTTTEQPDAPARPRTLRERQAEVTRDAILDAAMAIWLDDDGHDMTMQAVADRAGVSLRTLYRYFPNRRSLIEAAGDRMDERLDQEVEHGAQLPASAEDLPDQIRRAFRLAAAKDALFRRFLATSILGGTWRQGRDERYRAVLRAAFPHVDDATFERAFVAFRHLGSAINAPMLVDRFGIDPEEAAEAVVYGVELILEDLARRERAATAA